MKKLVSLFAILAMVFTLASCGSKTEDNTVKIGMLLTTSGLGDNNFNDMGYAGLQKAEADFGIEFDYVQPASVSDYVSQLRAFAQTEEYDLVIGLGNDMIEAFESVAGEYPEQKFSIVDSASSKSNLNGIYTKMEEQNFLAGVLAGLATKEGALEKSNPENHIGIVMGIAYPNLLHAEAGFKAGAKYVNPEVEFTTKVANTFADAALGKTLATDLFINKKADIILHIAGATGLGVFTAAKDEGFYAIGMGNNQNLIEPDAVIATALRAVDGLVYNEAKAITEGTWEGGTHSLGLAEGVVDFTIEGTNVLIAQGLIDTVEAVRKQVIDGELTIPNADSYEAWILDNSYTK